jgi:hypothetical protein
MHGVISPTAISTSFLLFRVKWDFQKSVHAHANMIFTLHNFYVILQVAGLGYLTGGIIIVAEPPKKEIWYLPAYAAGNLNF